MKIKTSTKDRFKAIGVDLSTHKKVNARTRSTRNAPGLKKGSGGIDDTSLATTQVAESVFPLMSQLNEQIEDITDTPEGQNFTTNPDGGPSSDDALGDGSSESVDGEGAGVTRYVPGAHLIYKRQSDADAYEELWIFRLDPKSPTAHSDIEEQIFAGTDVDPANMASEDGSQQARTWIAGNAKYIHITGLAN